MAAAPTRRELRETSDLEDLLRRAVAEPAVEHVPGAVTSYDWLRTAIDELPPDRAAALVHAAGRLLTTGTSDEVFAAAVLLKAWRHCQPAQREALRAALRDDSHVRAVGGVPLLKEVWTAAASGAPGAPDDYLAWVRATAHRPELGRSVLAWLAVADAGWLADHAVDIVRDAPDALGVLLSVLSQADQDLLPVIDALDGVVSRGPLRLAIRDEVLGADRRARLLAHLDG